MSITSIGWNTDQVIQINKADMTLIQTTPVVIYRLDTDQLFRDLKDEERTVDGMPWPDTQRNAPPTTLGGVTYARVLEIIDPYTITFENDSYVVQLIGSNNNIIEKTNPNLVSIQGNNSAGLIQVEELQYSAYQNGVTVNTLTGSAGQAYPIGTKASPVNNLTDALFIANLRGFDRIFLEDSITIPNTLNFDDFTFTGQSAHATTVTLAAGAQLDQSEFIDCQLIGDATGIGHAIDCNLNTLTNFNGEAHRCGLEATITLANTGASSFINCFSLVPGTTTPEIILGSGCSLKIRNYAGGIELSGKTGTDAVSIDMSSGQIVIADDNTTGAITLRGVAKWTNKQTYIGTTTVNDELLTAAQIQEVWRILGLEPGNAITITPSGVDSQDASIDINFTGDGISSTVMDRQ